MDAAQEISINIGMVAAELKERLTAHSRRCRRINEREDVVEIRRSEYEEFLLDFDLLIDIAKVTA